MTPPVLNVLSFIFYTTAQPVSCRRLFIAARFQSQARLFQVCGGQWGRRGRFFSEYFGFSPASIISPVFHNHLYLHVAITRRTNGVKPEDLPVIKVLSEMWKHWIENYFRFFLFLFEEFRYRITSNLRRAIFFTHFYELKIRERLKCEVLFLLFEALKSIILPEEKWPR